MSIELSEFYQTFFDEASEHLAAMESLLVDLDVDNPDLDSLNAIFRSAHSIKGGAGMFGFTEMIEVTHILETLLDRLRKSELALRVEMVDAFLQSADIVKGQIAARQGADPVEDAVVKHMCELLERLASGEAAPAAAPPASAEAESAPVSYDIRFSREGNQLGDPAPFDWLVDTLTDLGQLEVLDQGRTAGSKAHLRLTEPRSLDEVREAFAFFVQPDQYEIVPVGAVEPEAATPEPVPEPVVASKSKEEIEAEQGFGFFDDDLPAAKAESPKPTVEAANVAEPVAKKAEPAEPAKQPQAAAAPAPAPVPKPAVKPEEKVQAKSAANAQVDSSIRVNVEKVDQLINLAGELVITQAMLKQTASEIDPLLHENLLNGIAQLERNTRDLQEAVMSIRMMPMSFVFSRFPRMVRDLAAKLNKEINFKTQGEGTELDKGLIEKITDPLTHLVRNSLDHGIELPDVRESKGKDRRGNLVLRASHQGGNVVIEVQDDGAGLNRQKILAKAKERGMSVSDSMSDQDVWQLILAPGFSTAEVVTDVSGRGVGMDVVKKNIESLGGRVEIESFTGAGTKMTIRLPLTLAILDGLSIAVGSETFIIPLTSIIESLQPDSEDIKSVANQGRVVHVRGEYLPLIALYQVFNIRPKMRRPEDGTLMIVEADGVKAAFLVDELLGQHQVVIKSLETNYRKVPGISGATIMGDGRVALILDVTGLVRLYKSNAMDWPDPEPETATESAEAEDPLPGQYVVVSDAVKASVKAEEESDQVEHMLLERAIEAHQKWKTRLRMTIQGQGEKLVADEVCKDHLCDLGKWIHGTGGQYRSMPAYLDLKSKHAQFHQCAGEIVRKLDAGDKAGAERMLESSGEFSSASNQTVTAIRRLEKDLHEAHLRHERELMSGAGQRGNGAGEVNLQNAVDAHQNWKMRLRMMLDGQGEKPDPVVVEKDNACDLGKWIYGDGARFQSLSEYQHLKKTHAHFHKCAAEVVRSFAGNKIREAKQMLESSGSFAHASVQTINAIKRLERALKEHEMS